MDWNSDTLYMYFADDFANFIKKGFSFYLNNDRCIMCDLLRKQVVYVWKGRGFLIADALLEVVEEASPWPKCESPIRDPTGVAVDSTQVPTRNWKADDTTNKASALLN